MCLSGMTRAVLRSTADGSRVVVALQDSRSRRSHVVHATRASAACVVLEHLATGGENLVQRILKVCRGIRELSAHLIDVLFVTLLDLFLEKLAECAVAQTFLAPLRKVGHEIGDERA